MQMPNCVPEYYRELQEREEHEYELRQKRYAHYEESKRRIEEANEKGYPILDFGGYDECRCCEKKFDVQVNEYDDFGSLICYDKSCVCHMKGE